MRTPRSPLSHRLASMGCGLTVNLSLIRIGAGAFAYNFGALDDADNPLTKSYMNVAYDHLYSASAVRVVSRANLLPVL